jgi:hypothetical protein
MKEVGKKMLVQHSLKSILAWMILKVRKSNVCRVDRHEKRAFNHQKWGLLHPSDWLIGDSEPLNWEHRITRPQQTYGSHL